MEDLLQWLQQTTGTDVLRMIDVAAGASPLLAVTVGGLTLLTAAASRSLSFTLASALSAAIAVFIAGTPTFDGVEYWLAITIIILQLLILTGAWGFQRRISRQRSSLNQLLAERDAIQERLDDEIRWRQASESPEEPLRAMPSSEVV